MLVVNFFGGPGCGKSTTSAWLFSELKSMGISCEYVTEAAKDLTWEGNLEALSCQEYVFGLQSWRMTRVKDKVDIVITDSPLPLSIIYNRGRLPEPEFSALVWQVYNEYDNINIYLSRSDEYETSGRNESYEEAKEIDNNILNMMTTEDIGRVSFYDIDDIFTRDNIMKKVMDRYQELLVNRRLNIGK